MSSLVQRAGTQWPDVFSWLENSLLGWPAAGTRHAVRVEDYVEDNTYVVRAELPGFDPEKDITVQVNQGQMLITATREHTDRASGRSEFRYGAFARSITLPAGVKGEEISASYQHGILEVRLPFAQAAAAKPVKIEIAKK